MLCAVIGLIFGAWAPDSLGWLRLISDLYVNLLSMAATPLVVVAVFFGLRQIERRTWNNMVNVPTPKSVIVPCHTFNKLFFQMHPQLIHRTAQ
jgi:L-cystine uptake protein TcyP (sodium:dicarboxylate symporter family)